MADGTVFPGVHRKSILELSNEIEKELGVQVIEKKISIHEIIEAHREDRV